PAAGALVGLFALRIFRGAVLGWTPSMIRQRFWAGPALSLFTSRAGASPSGSGRSSTGIAARLRRGRGDSHGSARFADKKDLARMEGGTGLIVGRNPNTGRLLTL
ncbi:hypothetical protein, partial [Loktanella sp. M215]|uniref:hypothetical protein n=1 Tax=Loktanella sp. M215 TaxID=2675431 RepID=UPI001F39A81B